MITLPDKIKSYFKTASNFDFKSPVLHEKYVTVSPNVIDLISPLLPRSAICIINKTLYCNYS